MKKTLILALLSLIAFSAHTQKMSHEQFIKDSTDIMRVKLVRPQVKFDNRLTFFEGQTLSINGFDAGVLLKDKLRLTLGYYRLNDDLNALKQTVDSVDFIRLIDLNYGTINTEIIYSNTRYFSLGMPLEIGAGYATMRTRNFITDEITMSKGGAIGMAHFGLSATFKPIRWVGLKGMVGYRKTVFNQLKEFNFDGIFTSLGLNVDFHEIIKDIRMMQLKKKYKRGNQIENAVDLITD